MQFLFQILSKPCLLSIHAELFAALPRLLHLCSCVLSNVGSVPTQKDLLKDVQISYAGNWSPAWKWGQNELECQSQWHVPTCPLSFESVFGFFSFPVSLISSRQALWRGLKAFAELSLGLINAHFLLEILAQTHHRLWVIRWWHSGPLWLKDGDYSIQ